MEIVFSFEENTYTEHDYLCTRLCAPPTPPFFRQRIGKKLDLPFHMKSVRITDSSYKSPTTLHTIHTVKGQDPKWDQGRIDACTQRFN
jgi:hypothetical protein